MRKIERISISAADREWLERLVRGRNTPQKVVWRARDRVAGQQRAEGGGDRGDGGQKSTHGPPLAPPICGEGVDGLLKDATRPSRAKPLSPDKIKQVVHMTLHEKPPNATHWSVRSMAAVAGVSYSSVQRIWRAHGLKPHLVETFKVPCFCRDARHRRVSRTERALANCWPGQVRACYRARSARQRKKPLAMASSTRLSNSERTKYEALRSSRHFFCWGETRSSAESPSASNVISTREP